MKIPEQSLSELMERTKDMAPEERKSDPLPAISDERTLKVYCDGCGQEVIAYLYALQKNYHPSCFRCAACHDIIDPSYPFAYVYASVFNQVDGKEALKNSNSAQNILAEERDEARTQPGMGNLILCQSTSDSTVEKCSIGGNLDTSKRTTLDPTFEKLPLHSNCYAELYGVKCCVCLETIPADPETHRVSYIRHPFFEHQKVCPSHVQEVQHNDAKKNPNKPTSRRCTGCHRFEPLVNGGFADIGDADRCICMSCCRTVITDHQSARPLWGEVIAFLEHKLGLQIWDGMRDIPILVVNSSDLYDSQMTLSAHQGSTQIMTRGMCLSEQSDFIDECDNHIESRISVTAILCLSGLPADLTSSILAHEAAHAWFKLHPNYSNLDPIDKVAEEGCCQLIAMLFLTEGLSESILDIIEPIDESYDEPSDVKLRQYFRFCIETENDDVYGKGYRTAAQVYSSIGIQALLEHVVDCKTLPSLKI